MLRLIARREFLQIMRSRGFWLTTIGTPLMLLVMMAVTNLITGPVGQPIDALIEEEKLEGVIGFVDRSGIIKSIPYPAPEQSFLSFDTEAEAEAFLCGVEYVNDSDCFATVVDSCPKTIRVEG